MSSSRSLLLLSLFLISHVCFAQRHYLSFNADTDSVQNAVQLPADARALLTSDREDFPNGTPKHLRCSGIEHPPKAGEPEEQLLCTTLHLSSSSGKDYLVIGVGGLRGAHIVPFWIIHQGPHEPAIVFKTRADALTILSSVHNGYAELVATFMYEAGARIRDERYRFDGKSYKLFSSRETRN
jgi:hypothetical protein